MSTKPQASQLQTEIPPRILSQMQRLVDSGWYKSLEEVVVLALRKYLESHRAELMEELIREDVEWGLRGAD